MSICICESCKNNVSCFCTVYKEEIRDDDVLDLCDDYKMNHEEKIQKALIAFESWYYREPTEDEYTKIREMADEIEEDDSRNVTVYKILLALEQ